MNNIIDEIQFKCHISFVYNQNMIAMGYELLRAIRHTVCWMMAIIQLWFNHVYIWILNNNRCALDHTNQLASKCHLIMFIELCIDSKFVCMRSYVHSSATSPIVLVYGWAKTIAYAHFDNKIWYSSQAKNVSCSIDGFKSNGRFVCFWCGREMRWREWEREREKLIL